MKLERITANTIDEAGEPDSGGEDIAPREVSRRRRRGRTAALAAHRAFAPLLGTWGAALFGLAVLVLPATATARFALLAGLAALGGAAHYLIAALAALAGGAFAFGIARAASLRVRRAAADSAFFPATRPRPIRPAEELGSESLDAPLEKMPLGMKVADWLGRNVAEGEVPQDGEAQDAAAPEGPSAEEHAAAAMRRRLARVRGEAQAARAPAEDHAAQEDDAEDAAPAAEPAEAEVETPADAETNAETQAPETVPELDLARFAQLSGRNAVWVEGPLPESIFSGEAQDDAEPAPEKPQERPRFGSAAIEHLRATPAKDLSLVQMVERLAAALHEREAAEQARGSGDAASGNDPRRNAARDAALAEAIRVLGVLAGGDNAAEEGEASGDPATRELAAALTRLHDMRGAA